jgi:hypothetical protein
VKVLAPDPNCACANNPIPGTIDYVLKIPNILGMTDDFTIRGLCGCVRAIEIVAEEEFKNDSDPGSPPKTIVTHIPIVEKPK